MDTSEAVAARIRERAEELERFFDRIISCRVGRRVPAPSAAAE
jgi:ribosome-associated translation inhibitor RaiA